MSDDTARLDAIDSRLAAAAPGAITITPSDVAFLLDLARKQQAAIDAVTALHYEGIAYADDVPEGNDEPVPEDYRRHYCHQDGETWPCEVVAAIEEALEAKP